MENIFNNKILSNLFSLTAAEIASRVLGFFTLAYLGRVLDPAGFGILGFAAAFISYFLLIVNFGFNTYGTREIAKNQNKIELYVNPIFSIRIVLAILLIVLLILYTIFSGKNILTKYIILISGINILANAIALNWVFQAVEKMQHIAIRQILSGVLSLAGVIIFVHSNSDIVVAASILSLSALVGNLWLIPVYSKLYKKIKFEFSTELWKKLFRESFPLAFASIMIGIYYNLDMVMLGYMKPESDVGIYNAAFKIFLLGIVPFQLIFSSYYPELSRIGLKKTLEFVRTIKTYIKFVNVSGILVGLILFLFAGRIVLLVFGAKYAAAAEPLSILALNAFLVGVNVSIGNPMIAWSKQKEYAIAITFGAITNIVLNLILIPKYSYTGAAVATLFSEVSVFIGLFFLFRKFTRGFFMSNKE